MKKLFSIVALLVVGISAVAAPKLQLLSAAPTVMANRLSLLNATWNLQSIPTGSSISCTIPGESRFQG